MSASTVSRVLGGDYPVSVATRTSVLRAVRELDYVADARAKAVAGVGTPTLAFVLDDITGPSFAHMAHGVEREATRLGHLCLVCSTDGDTVHELEFVEMMRAQRAAAVILVGGTADTPEYRSRMARIADSLASAGSRLVLCGRPPLAPGTPVTVIEYDNEGGAYALCAHVLAQGHQRVLFLGGQPDHTTAQGRERGYAAAHRARGLEPDPALRLHGDFTRDSGHRLMRRALSQGLEFTAVMAATDMVAAGALTALHGPASPCPVTSHWSGTTTSRSPATCTRRSPRSTSPTRSWAASPSAPPSAALRTTRTSICCWAHTSSYGTRWRRWFSGDRSSPLNQARGERFCHLGRPVVSGAGRCRGGGAVVRPTGLPSHACANGVAGPMPG